MSRAFDAIVLLGVELDAQDQPTQELQARVQAAAQAYARGAADVIVASGGRLPGHRAAEAAVMARLPGEAGVPDAAVVPEDQAVIASGNRGTVMALDSYGPAAQAYLNIARRLRGQRVRLLSQVPGREWKC